MKRQKVRMLLLLIMLLLFPVILYYFSPAIIIIGAIEGIITGSFIVFLLQFISAIFLGRAFCGYLCPVGGLQECAILVNDKAPKKGSRSKIKYGIWSIWIAIILACFLLAGRIPHIDFFYMTDHGVSVSSIYNYIIYYLVILIALLPPLISGKRAFCHYFCWMAPFMVFGSKLGRLLHIKGLTLEASPSACIGCHKCDKACPMSLTVSENVKRDQMADSECILCGACMDQCPKKAISYNWSGKRMPK